MALDLKPCVHCERPATLDPFGMFEGKVMHVDGCIITERCVLGETVAEL